MKLLKTTKSTINGAYIRRLNVERMIDNHSRYALWAILGEEGSVCKLAVGDRFEIDALRCEIEDFLAHQTGCFEIRGALDKIREDIDRPTPTFLPDEMREAIHGVDE
jgi:hypothetical protein